MNRRIISNYELRVTQFGHRNYDISSTTDGLLPLYNGRNLNVVRKRWRHTMTVMTSRQQRRFTWVVYVC